MKENTCPDCGHYDWAHRAHGCTASVWVHRVESMTQLIDPCPCTTAYGGAEHHEGWDAVPGTNVFVRRKDEAVLSAEGV